MWTYLNLRTVKTGMDIRALALQRFIHRDTVSDSPSADSAKQVPGG